MSSALAGRVDPYALSRGELAARLPDEPPFRADQVQRWLRRGVDNPSAMTDLPVAVRDQLAALFLPPPEVLRISEADGGLTRKVLLACDDGEAVESVLMVYPRARRSTVCISTQAGCAMGCPFCATGQAGFRRQLRLAEILRQVTVMQRLLADDAQRPAGAPDHLTNVVFMGMGEPLANLSPTLAAVRWLADPRGFGLSARAITVSTVGLVPGIRRLAALNLPVTLAVSLHAPTDELRNHLVPINHQHPLDELLAASRDYLLTTGRRLTFEYILIDGVNASALHARQLADLLTRRFRSLPLAAAAPSRRAPRPHVNLIPMNPTPGIPWHAPSRDDQEAFRDLLEAAGVPATIRRNRGGDIEAACGQLYANYAVASGRTLPSAAAGLARLQPPSP